MLRSADIGCTSSSRNEELFLVFSEGINAVSLRDTKPRGFWSCSCFHPLNIMHVPCQKHLYMTKWLNDVQAELATCTPANTFHVSSYQDSWSLWICLNKRVSLHILLLHPRPSRMLTPGCQQPLWVHQRNSATSRCFEMLRDASRWAVFKSVLLLTSMMVTCGNLNCISQKENVWKCVKSLKEFCLGLQQRHSLSCSKPGVCDQTRDIDWFVCVSEDANFCSTTELFRFCWPSHRAFRSVIDDLSMSFAFGHI